MTTTTKSIEVLKNEIRTHLEKTGYEIDGCFEGDYETWLGCYAIPKGKPTYLDARNETEYELQQALSINGFKQDFSEWFEFYIKNGEIDFDDKGE